MSRISVKSVKIINFLMLMVISLTGVLGQGSCDDGISLPIGFLPKYCLLRPTFVDAEYTRSCGDLVGNCQSECYLNYTGVLTATNTLNNDSVAILRSYDADPTDLDLVPMFTKGLEFCLAAANNRSNEFLDSLGNKPIDHLNVCSPFAKFIDQCTTIYEYANSADDVFLIQNPDCIRLRNFYKRCPIPDL